VIAGVEKLAQARRGFGDSVGSGDRCRREALASGVGDQVGLQPVGLG